eukprot:794728-Pelagomonas_calceolata.AAC.4
MSAAYIREKDLTNTIVKAELAAIAVAVPHGYSCIATNSLSLSTKSEVKTYPELYQQQVQGNVLSTITQLVHHFLVTASDPPDPH